MSESTTTRSAREQFDRQAKLYDHTWSRWTEESLRRLLEHSNATKADRVLDVATGTGFTATAFAPLVASVVGLDVSPGMLAEAEKRVRTDGLSNVTFREGPAEAMPFDAASFDVVTCRIAPHHFESIPTFLSECARVLVDGGRLLIADTTTPDGDAELATWQNEVERLRDPSHRHNLTPSEWRAAVEHAGFAIEALNAEGGHIEMELEDWMRKAGCAGEPADVVRSMFEEAASAAKEAFSVRRADNGEVRFAWQRMVMAAVKTSAV